MDLVKPERDLLLAYDDPLGLTAAFNKNLLLRLNTELHADFDLDRFAHRAVWNSRASRVEMHLVSRVAQEVRSDRPDSVPARRGRDDLDRELVQVRATGLGPLVEPAGFVQRQQWVDERAGFALTLFGAA